MVNADFERVMVFIDGSNLYYALRDVCGRHDIDFAEFVKKLVGARNLVRTYYYNGSQSEAGPSKEMEGFLGYLYSVPYLEVKLGVSRRRGAQMVEKGVDVMLATDIVVHAMRDNYDTAIVVSGDADFYPALEAARTAGKHIEVIAFEVNLSPEIARNADVVNVVDAAYFDKLWRFREEPSKKRRLVSSGRTIEQQSLISTESGKNDNTEPTRELVGGNRPVDAKPIASTKTKRDAEPKPGWDEQVLQLWENEKKDVITAPLAAPLASKALGVSALRNSKYKTLRGVIESSKLLSRYWRVLGNKIMRHQSSSDTPPKSIHKTADESGSWAVSVAELWDTQNKDVLSGSMAGGLASQALGVPNLRSSDYKTLKRLVDASPLLKSKWKVDGSTVVKLPDWAVSVAKLWDAQNKDVLSGSVAGPLASQALGVSNLRSSDYKTLKRLVDASPLLNSKWKVDGNTIVKLT